METTMHVLKGDQESLRMRLAHVFTSEKLLDIIPGIEKYKNSGEVLRIVKNVNSGINTGQE
uniref:Uncharacterized protein n=1 Tax=Arion vulgaris TaxID=1028688 RepID=A0A0B7BV31_9EUPU